MQQTFGVINHYIQDEGCGHDIICALWPVNSGENTAAGQMVNNCCVVCCTNYVGKKGLSFYHFPVANKERCERWVVVQCAETTGNLNRIQEFAMNILYQVMNRRIVRTWS